MRRIMSDRLDHHAVAGCASAHSNSSKSEMSPPGPTPSMKRPRLMWSNCAASAATIAGWWFGTLITAVPNVRFLVRGTRPAKNIIGEGIGSVVRGEMLAHPQLVEAERVGQQRFLGVLLERAPDTGGPADAPAS